MDGPYGSFQYVASGRSSTSANKGQLLPWLWAAEIFNRAKVELPVNLKMVIEGMKESESECLEDFVKLEATAGGFLHGADFVCIPMGCWASTEKPALVYGLRGMVTFEVTIKGGSKSLSTGSYSGLVNEPMCDMVRLLGSLVGSDDDINIAGVGVGSVPPVSQAELDDVQELTMSVEKVQEEAGYVPQLTGDDKQALMMNRCRFPSLSIHGIESSVVDRRMRRVIPNWAKGKFTIMLAPGQTAEKIIPLVREHLTSVFTSFESSNSVTVLAEGSNPWLVNPDNDLYKAAVVALTETFESAPDFIRDGHRIAAVEMFEKHAKVPVLVMPFGKPCDNAYSENERIEQDQYLRSVSAAMTFMDEIGGLPEDRDFVPALLAEIRNGRQGPISRVRGLWSGLS